MLVALPFFAAQVPARAAGAIAHHALAGKDVEVQREFDQGLTLLYAFNPEEATFHFQEAARRDPGLAMAYWGIAIAAGRNVNTDYDLSRAAVGRAATAAGLRAAGPAPSEARALLEALQLRYAASTLGAAPAAELAYARAMKSVIERYPADLDAKTLYAESLMDLTPLHMWHEDGSPNTYTREVISLLDGVLARNPSHLGAIHYLIHAYEGSKTPEKAVGAARRLAKLDLPPGAEHLAHMPAHVLARVGDYDGAIAANLKALAMFGSLLRDEHSDVHNAYYHHDYQVLNYAYMMSGQWANARSTAEAIARQVQDNAAGIETYLRFHKWREALALVPPPEADVRWRFAQGMAQAGAGNVGAARALLATLEGRDPRTRLAHALVDAHIAIAEKRGDAAIAALRSAVAIEDSLPPKEPPAWYYPVRETLGARLALAGKPAEAQRVFEDDLRQNPNNPRSLFGLATVLQQADPARSKRMMTQFKRAWQHADVPLTLEDL